MCHLYPYKNVKLLRKFFTLIISSSSVTLAVSWLLCAFYSTSIPCSCNRNLNSLTVSPRKHLHIWLLSWPMTASSRVNICKRISTSFFSWRPLPRGIKAFWLCLFTVSNWQQQCSPPVVQVQQRMRRGRGPWVCLDCPGSPPVLQQD